MVIVQEYRRKCNSCGKTWHSLVEREKEIERQIKYHGTQGTLACCYDHSAMAQQERNQQQSMNDLEKLRSCPECGSKNYTEEVITYEK
jgi:uncharacterized Zn finger protein